MSESSKKKYTVRDYELLPEGAPYQLIDGDLVMTPAPTTYHQIILVNLSSELHYYVKKEKLGKILFSPIDVYFSEIESYQPDIIFISKDNLNIIGEKRIEGSPDLIIEILSESTADYDLNHKKKIYEEFGVKEYWVVNPAEKSIIVWENIYNKFKLLQQAVKEDIISSKVISGFEIKIDSLF